MYKVLFNQPGRLALRVADFITPADYTELRPLLDTVLHSADSSNLYWEMEYFRGWQPVEMWRDLRFDLTVTADFSRIALVGTPAEIAAMTPVMQAISRAEVRSFLHAAKTVGWQWFNDGAPLNPPHK